MTHERRSRSRSCGATTRSCCATRSGCSSTTWSATRTASLMVEEVDVGAPARRRRSAARARRRRPDAAVPHRAPRGPRADHREAGARRAGPAARRLPGRPAARDAARARVARRKVPEGAARGRRAGRAAPRSTPARAQGRASGWPSTWPRRASRSTREGRARLVTWVGDEPSRLLGPHRPPALHLRRPAPRSPRPRSSRSSATPAACRRGISPTPSTAATARPRSSCSSA